MGRVASSQQWFWPLDAEVGADGHLWLFLAEVRNPNGSGAAIGAEPVATWRARYRLPDLELVDLEPAADAVAASLFGYSIVSDDDWTYLFGHCYKPVRPGAAGSGSIRRARRTPTWPGCPWGSSIDQPQYWSGAGWTARRSARRPVLTGQHSMPVSVERFGDVYVAASDEDDWFGSDVVIRTAPAPAGSVDRGAALYARDALRRACNNYGAFVLPQLEDDQVVIAHSNNAWDMRADAFADASLYRIGVRAVQRARRAGARRPPPPPSRSSSRRRRRDVQPAGRRRFGHGRSVDRRSPSSTARCSRPTPVDDRRAGATTCCGPLRIAGLGLAAAVALAATTGLRDDRPARRAAPSPPRPRPACETTGATAPTPPRTVAVAHRAERCTLAPSPRARRRDRVGSSPQAGGDARRGGDDGGAEAAAGLAAQPLDRAADADRRDDDAARRRRPAR